VSEPRFVHGADIGFVEEDPLVSRIMRLAHNAQAFGEQTAGWDYVNAKRRAQHDAEVERWRTEARAICAAVPVDPCICAVTGPAGGGHPNVDCPLHVPDPEEVQEAEAREAYLRPIAKGGQPRPGIPCDQECGAPEYPETEDGYRAAYTHWRFHAYLSGCSHAR